MPTPDNLPGETLNSEPISTIGHLGHPLPHSVTPAVDPVGNHTVPVVSSQVPFPDFKYGNPSGLPSMPAPSQYTPSPTLSFPHSAYSGMDVTQPIVDGNVSHYGQPPAVGPVSSGPYIPGFDNSGYPSAYPPPPPVSGPPSSLPPPPPPPFAAAAHYLSDSVFGGNRPPSGVHQPSQYSGAPPFPPPPATFPPPPGAPPNFNMNSTPPPAYHHVPPPTNTRPPIPTQVAPVPPPNVASVRITGRQTSRQNWGV